MSGHDEFEIAIEMQRHGALDSAEEARLQEHLRECPSCQAFREAANELEQAMRLKATAVANSLDFDQAKARVQSMARTYPRAVRLLILFGVVNTVIVAISLNSAGVARTVAGGISLGVAALFALAVALMAILARSRTREALASERTLPDLIACQKKKLERRIRLHRRMSVVEVVFGTLLLLGPLLAGSHLEGGLVSMFLALSLLVLAALRRWRAARFERDLAELR